MDINICAEYFYHFSDSIDIIPLSEAIQNAKIIGENFNEQISDNNIESILEFYREIYTTRFDAGFVEWCDVTGECDYNMCQCHDCAYQEEIPSKYYISSCPGEFIVCDICIRDRDFINTQITNAFQKYLDV
jgi:hypothetical protein